MCSSISPAFDAAMHHSLRKGAVEHAGKMVRDVEGAFWDHADWEIKDALPCRKHERLVGGVAAPALEHLEAVRQGLEGDFEGSRTPLGLPGRLMRGQPLRTPTTERLNMAIGVIRMVSVLMASAMPGT